MTYKELVRELGDLVLALNSKGIRFEISHKCTEIWFYDTDHELVGKIGINQSFENCQEYRLIYYDYSVIEVNIIDIDTAKKLIKNAYREV